MAEAEAPRDFRLGEGGLLHRIERRVHVTRLLPQLATTIAIAWLPLILLGIATELLYHRREALIRDISVHVRLLIAAPVFVAIDRWFPSGCRNALARLMGESFVRPADEPRFDRIVRTARHLTDSMVPEIVLALLAFGIGVCGVLGVVPIGGLALDGRPSAAQVWYGLAAWPFFQFLLWRSLWRWLVWTGILFAISRMDLALVPSHPDKRGGITFLSQPSTNYCALLLFALSSALSAEWAEKITIPNIENLDILMVAYVVAAALFAFGPLLPFALMLERARNAGLDGYGRMGTAYARELAAEHASEERAAVGPDRLAFMTIIFNQNVDPMRNVLFDRRDVVVLLMATLLPVVPVVLAEIPKEDWAALLRIVTGARLH